MEVTKFLKIYFLFIINNNQEKTEALRIAPMAFPISNRHQKIVEVHDKYYREFSPSNMFRRGPRLC